MKFSSTSPRTQHRLKIDNDKLRKNAGTWAISQKEKKNFHERGVFHEEWERGEESARSTGKWDVLKFGYQRLNILEKFAHVHSIY